MNKGPAIAMVMGAALGLYAVMVFPGNCKAGAEEGPDSTIAFGAVYLNLIDLHRESEPFAWNDPAAQSHLRDRVSVFMDLQAGRGFDVFLKGATGRERLEGDYHESGFILEQGHVAYSLNGEASLRLFSRERVYNPGTRLLRMVSDDSPLLAGRGEGAVLRAGLGKTLRVKYIASVLRERDEVEKRGGLPVLEGAAASMELLRCEASWRGVRAGITAGEARSAPEGDASFLSIDTGIDLGGPVLLAELAEASRGKWSDREDSRLIGFYPSRIRPNALATSFGTGTVFSAEVQGLSRAIAGWGEFGLIPGYTFHGPEIYDPLGETAPGIAESKLICWWKHPELSMFFSAELGERYMFEDDSSCRELRAFFETAFKGGLRATQGILASEGRKTSFVVSAVHDEARSRIRAAARLDDGDGKGRFYYLAEGSVSLSAYLSVTTALYLQGSDESFYSTGIEFRPSRRLLLRASAGSFAPLDGSDLIFGTLPAAVFKDRMITIYTRVWFGDI